MSKTYLAQFLETSASRAQLKEINLTNGQLLSENGQEGDQRLCAAFGETATMLAVKLEKFSFTINSNASDFAFFDGIDCSSLTVLNVAQIGIHPKDFTNLVNRCTQLRGLNFSFYKCSHAQVPFQKDLLQAVDVAKIYRF